MGISYEKMYEIHYYECDKNLNCTLESIMNFLGDVGNKHAESLNVVAGGHEVGEVVEFQLVVTARDDGIAASLDGYHMVGVVRTADVLERFVENLAALTQFDAEHHECSVVHIPALAHPTHL